MIKAKLCPLCAAVWQKLGDRANFAASFLAPTLSLDKNEVSEKVLGPNSPGLPGEAIPRVGGQSTHERGGLEQRPLENLCLEAWNLN